MAGSQPHEFDLSRSFSQAEAEAPEWASVYRRRWPRLVRIENVRDLQRQKLGIDRIIHVDGGQKRIDEKVRSVNYNDILLEIFSDFRARKPGWARDARNLSDYVCFLFRPGRRCLLIHSDEARRALELNGTQWQRDACCGLSEPGDWMLRGRSGGNVHHRGRNGMGLVRTVSTRHGHQWITISLTLPYDRLKCAMDDVNRLYWLLASGHGNTAQGAALAASATSSAKLARWQMIHG